MKKIISSAAFACAAAILITPSPCPAHGLEGDRFFPPTPLTDDPFAVDELSLPLVQYNPASASNEIDITGSFSKEIFPKFALSIQDTYINLNPKGGPAQDGWSPITLNAKYQLLEIPDHEFILAVGSDFELGGTGSKGIPSSVSDSGYNSYTTYTPNLYIGKGFNELPDGLKYLRPFAFTAVVGYSIPGEATNSDGSLNPNAVQWIGSLQYQLNYLQQHVEDVGIPKPFSNMIPLVEFQMSTPVNRYSGALAGTTGTLNPGILWEGKYCQISAEASIPVNQQSGPAIGGLIQVQVFIDDLFPKIFGHPIFGSDDNNNESNPEK
jgi:hypothetical protein